MYYIVKKKGLEQTLHFKHLEQQQAEEFHNKQIRMFTNFSHELRTPLTLIISPLQELLRHEEFSSAIKGKLSLIYNNSQRLLLLVNQLMDMRKNQSGKMQLKIAKEDILSFVMELYYAFNQLALNKHINLQFECNEEKIRGWLDKSLFEKVVFNLLSNAFKHTHEGGSITIGLKCISWKDIDEEHRTELADINEKVRLVHLVVSDTGCGIPETEMKNIFVPFYQIESDKSVEVTGTGIGLSLTQSIVQLHHGTIWAENNEQGGAVFHVILPVDRFIYTDDEMDKERADRVVVDVIPSSDETVIVEGEKKYKVLLVEDNDEVRSYVKNCLMPYFYVLDAVDGEKAFELVVDEYPDIVVSDIMMPKIDGLELCSKIKQDMRTGHIPVILMTAKSMVMHIKEGFSCGADDYIIKPFNIDVLIYRIKNIMDSREKLRSLYGKRFSPESLGFEIVSNDERFTQKFFEIIEQNIANPELNIDLICKEIGLSRTNLYRKLKAVTDLSPVELIKNKRLEIAAKLLLESDYNVTEISIYVGFNSAAYFTQCFRNNYGCSPTEYATKYKELK
jgi:DNA-binding response OmpR family regulator/nitrogen-specific signal transduction histidine kinase